MALGKLDKKGCNTMIRFNFSWLLSQCGQIGKGSSILHRFPKMQFQILLEANSSFLIYMLLTLNVKQSQDLWLKRMKMIHINKLPEWWIWWEIWFLCRSKNKDDLLLSKTRTKWKKKKKNAHQSEFLLTF